MPVEKHWHKRLKNTFVFSKLLYHKWEKMKREKKLILDYGIGSVTYTDIRNFKIQYPYIVIDGENVSLVSVRFVKYKNFIAWKNKRR